MSNGGYDSGYKKCPCYWGQDPANLVLKAADILNDSRDLKAMDFGCGEGKNSFALASRGFSVVAIDCSEYALKNATSKHSSKNIMYLQASINDIKGPSDTYDLALATGSLHCLENEDQIIKAIRTMQTVTKVGGINVVTGFDLGPHDLSGHPTDFHPTLLPYTFYLGQYEGWNIIESSSTVQEDIHPDNEISHHHSITRLLAIKTA
ncbi:tellurite methyltransferase [Alteromonadaceae bacterium 2753L.S.0a.02]|nr:tellurite methyltransferase [Alteromonadaceae bacterium 2753L.S.0a.02]